MATTKKAEENKPKTLDEAIMYVQQTAPIIEKASENPFYNSKYADLVDVWKAIKPILKEAKLSTSHYLQVIDGQQFMVSRLTHLPSSEYRESKSIMMLDKKTAQALGSYITYLRRYDILMMLGVHTGDDDDGNAASSNKPVIDIPKKAFEAYQSDLNNTSTLEELQDMFKWVKDDVRENGWKFSKVQMDIIVNVKDKKKGELNG